MARGGDDLKTDPTVTKGQPLHNLQEDDDLAVPDMSVRSSFLAWAVNIPLTRSKAVVDKIPSGKKCSLGMLVPSLLRQAVQCQLVPWVSHSRRRLSSRIPRKEKTNLPREACQLGTTAVRI
jgi:hypothetical protein